MRVRAQAHLPAALVATLVAVAALAGATSPAAAVEPTSTLPTRAVDVRAPGSMVFARDHLYLSGDDSLYVLDTDGTVRSRLRDLPGATDVLASATGDKVYVALRTAGAVAVVDTATLTVARWPVAPCPSDLAVVGERLFFSAGCEVLQTTIASVDRSTGGPVVPSGISDEFYRPPALAGAGHVLVAATDENPSTVSSYRVAGASLTRLATNSEGSGVDDVAVSPDGASAYTTGGYPQDVVRTLPTATLEAGRGYHTDAWPQGVAVSADGKLVASGATGDSGANLLVFATGSTEAFVAGSAHPREEFNQPPALPRTVTFSADGSRVFALVGGPEHTYLTSSPTRAGLHPSELTLAVEQPTSSGGPTQLTATLAGRAGTQVEIRVASPGATSITSTTRVSTDAHGRAVSAQVLPAGAVVYAAYAGDDEHQAAQSDTVTVLDFTGLRLGPVTSPRGRSGTLTASAVLAPPRAGAQVTFVLDESDEPSRGITVDTDAKGVARLSEAVGAGGRLTATYGGDATHQPSATGQVTWTVASTTRASLYGTHTTKHHKLRYRKASKVLLDIEVEPARAAEVHVQLQRRSGKHWKTDDESTEPLEDGGLTLQLDSARKHKDLRFVVAFDGDDVTRASQATSKTFVVG